jgi:multicomponent Na+:H+ antiporter subunit G
MIITGIILITIGVSFSTLGALGLIRMPDLYNRLQTSTKATTLGAFATIVGAGFLRPEWLIKTLVIAFFLLATAPISSHNLAKAAHKFGIRLTDETSVDKYAEDLEKRGEDQ